MSEVVYAKNIHTAKINALFGPITKVGTGISYVVALGYGAHLVVTTEAMTVGQLVTFNVYLGLAVWPIFAIGELINVMRQGNASLDRVQETLNYEADVQNIPNPQMIATPNTIGFDALTFQYPMSQVKNLQQISLSLKKAKRLALLVKREQVKQPSYANYCENTQSVRDSFPLTVSILPLKRRSRSSIGLVMCHKIMCYSHELFVKIYYLGKKMQHKQSCDRRYVPRILKRI